MHYPKFLTSGGTIGVTAPSDGITKLKKIHRLDQAIKTFQQIQFKVILTPNVRTSVKGRSSSSKEQARQLESLFLNDDVDIIMCAEGGDFLLEMLSDVDFSIIAKHPKWLQGYSDPTGLLYTITTNLDIATIYGDNFCNFGMKPWHSSLQNNLEFLKGNIKPQYSFDQYENAYLPFVTGTEPYTLTQNVYWENLTPEKVITMKGRMIGGCIDLLNDLFGTRFDKTKKFIETYKQDGIIWYFDNCEFTSEQLIRTLWKFRDNGWFQYCKGIIFGRSATNASNYDISFLEAIRSSLEMLQIPIIVNADIGHVAPRMTIINGALASVTSEGGCGKISFYLD